MNGQILKPLIPKDSMKKIVLSLLIITAITVSSTISAQPETWYGKLAATPLQITNHNAYLLTGCVTTPIAVYAACFLHMLYSNLDKVRCDESITPEIKNMIIKTNPAIPAIALAAAYAGVTFVGGALTKSSTKALMNAFDIPELK